MDVVQFQARLLIARTICIDWSIPATAPFITPVLRPSCVSLDTPSSMRRRPYCLRKRIRSRVGDIWKPPGRVEPTQLKIALDDVVDGLQVVRGYLAHHFA